MVELKLDVAEDKLPADCFISVRVGETQKLSRIAATRSYQFPKAGERRYGKIEIYRRIGQAGVDVDPLNSGERQVSVGCGDWGSLKLNVMVSDGSKPAGAAPAEAAADHSAAAPTIPGASKKEEGGRSKAAKDYLRKHSLELHLSEAMQALLQTRPDNPVQFLAQKLLENMDAGAIGLPKELAAAAAAPAPKAAAPAQGRAPPSVELLPFGKYFEEFFKTIPAAGWSLIHKRFPGPKKVVETYPSASASASPVAAPAASAPQGSFVMKPSVGSWLMAKPKNFSPPAPAMSKPSQAAKAAPPAAVTSPGFALRPSVGTWLMPRPAAAPVQVAAAATAAPAAASATPPASNFIKKPSVGSWLMSKPFPVAPVSSASAPPAPAKPTTAAATAAPSTTKTPAPIVMDKPTVDYPFPSGGGAMCVSSGVFSPHFNALGLAPKMVFI
mmetsp:Transcript_74679/g.163189  ORF Transcript_74679/g.163189 Transcript_74679/m.163189 type:complete len:441 (-) Transcript_74679:94-1416(-)